MLKEKGVMNNIWENIFRFRKRADDEIETILLKVPVFQDLNKRELNKIKRILHQREYSRDEKIFNEGDIGLGMYIIIEGEVRIVCGPENQILADLSGGDFFGELSLLDDAPRSAAAVAKTPCVTLSFFKPELLDLLNRDPQLGCKILFKLAWVIGERLKSTNEQLRVISCQRQQDSTSET
jgi:CRP-like cAMP-binding protein